MRRKSDFSVDNLGRDLNTVSSQSSVNHRSANTNTVVCSTSTRTQQAPVVSSGLAALMFF